MALTVTVHYLVCSIFISITLLHLGRSVNSVPVLTGNASAVMYAAHGYGLEKDILGTIYFQQFTDTLASGNTVRYVNITGLVISIFPGNNNHGIHIHETPASLQNDGCSGIGKHFNPLKVQHGNQNGNASTRHVGDLGNVRSDSSGKAKISFVDNLIHIGSKDKWYDVVNLPVAIHSGMDDLGMGGADTSFVNGNSGGVIACGNIYLYRGNATSAAMRFEITTYLLAITLLIAFAAIKGQMDGLHRFTK